MNWIAVGAIALALAVTIGAFGAHVLQARLDNNSMTVYERAVFYHFVHALGILLVATLISSGKVPSCANITESGYVSRFLAVYLIWQM